MTHIDDLLNRIATDADACERSWSIGESEIEERVLFFFEMSVEAARLIAEGAVALGMDAETVSAWSKALPAADAIGLALRTDRKSVRLYTQYWEVIAERVRNGDASPFAVYRGFKALPGGVVRHDDYVCLPMAPREVFWPPISAALSELGADAAAAEAVFAPLDAGNAIFTATQSTERTSWLTTVRRAELDPSAVSALLASLAERKGGADIIEAAANGPLIHIAGGRDLVKGSFITLYFGSSAGAALARLI